MTKKFARTFGCPSEFTLHVLGGKWKTVILCYLKEQPLRYADLRRLVPNLSDKVLTERLADLSERGLITRKRIAGPPARELYQLTPLGRSLNTALTELYRWGQKHADQYGVSVGDPLARLPR